MRQTQLFTRTRKEVPADEVAKNAQLLLRAGYMYKEMAGAYVMLPLGLRVIKNIENIVREEMNSAGGQEVSMTALQDKSTWEATGRWSDEVVDNWFKSALKGGQEVGLAFTHEEPLTKLMASYISSYRDLPIKAYQFQTKFRNEARAKSGIMRGREFIMKDLYTFCRTPEEQAQAYEEMAEAYQRIFVRAGLGTVTYKTFASGGTFSKYSHEFQTITDAGEDMIYIHHGKHVALNEEVLNDEVLADLGMTREELTPAKAVEVGNIFTLGTKFSDAFDLNYVDEAGEKKKVVMGSYGIGIGRLMGAIVEVLGDEKGIVWPEEVAPFKFHLVALNYEDADVKDAADKLYADLRSRGVEVLFDDRVGISAGEKFADSDLLGMPKRIVVSKKTLASGEFEVKDRKTGEVRMERQF
jgi:prolyl-tRNA synthetase